MQVKLVLRCRASRKQSAHQQRSYTIDTKFWRDPGVANFKVRGANYLKVSALLPHSALRPCSLLARPPSHSYSISHCSQDVNSGWSACSAKYLSQAKVGYQQLLPPLC